MQERRARAYTDTNNLEFRTTLQKCKHIFQLKNQLGNASPALQREELSGGDSGWRW